MPHQRQLKREQKDENRHSMIIFIEKSSLPKIRSMDISILA